MSTVKQRADAEAERVEAELADDEQTDPAEAEPGDGEDPEDEHEHEPEPEPEPESGRSDKQTKAMFDRALRAFHDKLCVVFEVDQLEASATPGVIGFVLPGFSETKTHPNFTRCLTCNGKGVVLTQSEHVGDETATCPDTRCKGRGYWQKGAPVAPATGPLAVTPPEQAGSQNEWGEAPAWMGDPSLTPGT